MTAPKAAKRPYPLTTYNDTRIDNYYWLRDDERADPDVLAYLQQENDYSRTIMEPQDGLKQSLYEEMVARIPSEDMSVPYVRNGYRYQSRYEPGKEYPIYRRQPENVTDEWETLLDGNQRSENHEFYSLGVLAVSPDNQLLVISEDFLSRRQYDIRFRDLKSGEWLPDIIEKVSAGAEWSADSRVIYYVRKHPQTLLPYQVYRHRLGSDPASDELVYEEKDDTYYVSLGKTTSERYITIYLSSTTSTEVLLVDTADDDAAPRVFIGRRKDHEYFVDHYRGVFYLRSNREGKNFGLYRTNDLGEDGLETLIAPREHRVLENFELFRDWLVVEEREKGLTCLRQIRWQTQEEKNITFNDASYVTWLSYNPTPETALLRYGYASMTTPSSLYELNMDTGRQQLLKQAEVKNFATDNYRNERLWITARDGVEVPVSLVYHREHFKPGRNPILIYGYGAYGSSMDPDFSVSRLSLLDRGFVFALTHIRGGGELGQQWYDDGRLLNKMHSFTDFIDVSLALAEKGYGDRQKMFAMGGSAGGLLMGAVVNFAPDLFKGVIAQVPFVDVLTTMLDESIPLTTGEYDEWGDPNDRTYYDYIKQYSPYDGVTAQDYPHMLVTTGLHDSQVQYWEPAKWVAKLREMKTDKRLLLLYTDMDAGHGGKSGRFKHYEDIALEYAFLLMVLETD
ncbi:prolyl oligopeptidase family serine peptidase [Brenneria goodwinii]|nr:prolyl oligopeptidase family serine peptidase [Brenneria goodwinii]MCG8155160.1 prolyl oligopeptidase family serine peptidase [Brenneria goodwinii]MCG8159404.1 prolyl oligopeptidase family serine peptidase [Brenneria goodwinii]MCG8164427.1 prolyl oligopeptidase family serine peptidase [Brenneria goodwinii]MCG8169007.1 prolyl oligopeptidase family serine peptidase [Brenneria goodwinii]MCG8173263.1 prolyl oligopeptidase family serine peptidase [Brenneria goodwinii]